LVAEDLPSDVRNTFAMFFRVASAEGGVPFDSNPPKLSTSGEVVDDDNDSNDDNYNDDNSNNCGTRNSLKAAKNSLWSNSKKKRSIVHQPPYERASASSDDVMEVLDSHEETPGSKFMLAVGPMATDLVELHEENLELAGGSSNAVFTSSTSPTSQIPAVAVRKWVVEIERLYRSVDGNLKSQFRPVLAKIQDDLQGNDARLQRRG